MVPFQTVVTSVREGSSTRQAPYLPLFNVIILSGLSLLILLFHLRVVLCSRRFEVTFTSQHRLWGILRLLTSITCAVAILYSRINDWTGIVAGNLWILVTVSHTAYLTTSSYRQVLYVNSLYLSLSLLVTTTIPVQVYPLIWLHGRDVRSFSTPDLIEIGAACATAVLIPLLTPYHTDISVDHPHPSETCSPLSRWWLYSWVTPVVQYGYAHHGDLCFDDLLPINPQSCPEHWLDEYNIQRENAGSFQYTLWVLFRWRLAVIACFMVVCGAFEFTGILGLRQLLLYLQRSPDVWFRPWFSIALFGLRPALRGLCMQTFEYHATHIIGHWKATLIPAIYQKLLKLPLDSDIDLGQLQTNISADIDRLGTLRYTVMTVFMAPVEIVVASIMLYRTLGWSFIPGIVFLVVTQYPLSKFILSAEGVAQSRILRATDARIAQLNECIRNMIAIKMLGRVQTFAQLVLDKRGQELKEIWKKTKVIVASESISTLLTFVSLIICLFLYTVVSKHRLEADTAFTLVATFDIIKSMFSLGVTGTGQYAQAMVSLKRLGEFLDHPERPALAIYPVSKVNMEKELGFQNASFGISESDGSVRMILRNLNVKFVKGSINVLTGSLGSGKSFLLQSLLGEQQLVEGTVALRNTPFESVAYSSQSPWLQNGTIRDNILFGSSLLLDRYEEVIFACGLASDLKIFEEGDLKQIGENGSQLSGGQRQRIALARAVYSNTRVVILDDVFSAIDAVTQEWIMDHCILGPLIKGRTLIIITDNRRIIQEADLVVHMEHGSIKESIRRQRDEAQSDAHPNPMHKVTFTKAVPEEEAASRNTTPTQEGSSPDSQILPILDTHRQGLIGMSYVMKYIRRFGNWPFILLSISFVISAQAMEIAWPAWLAFWVDAGRRKSDDRFYLCIFAGAGTAQVLLFGFSLLFLYAGAWRASRDMHMKLLATISSAAYIWIVSTPAGQIINRFSSDMASLDDALMRALRPVLETYLSIGFRIITVSSLVPVFILPSVLLTIHGIYTGFRYRFASTAVKRISAATLSPLHHSVNEAISGLVTIRAFRAELRLQKQMNLKVAQHVRSWEAVSNLQRWLAVRMDLHAFGISFSAAILSVLQQHASPSTVGLGLTLTTGLCESLLYVVYLSSLLEVEMNSLHRIDEYIEDVPQEYRHSSETIEGDQWPTQGDISVKHLTAGYSLDSNNVLHDVSFEARSREKIAIVGRTGSGKSSIALSLLRLTTKFSGSIYIDGVDIEKLDVEQLRQGISLIPQDPALFNGTLRFNLDLTGTVSDKRLQGILDSVAGRGKWRLDDIVESNGQNFSQGERQLIALGRAIANRSRLVIIDEATAHLDHASDTRIQMVLRERFHNSTVIAIAHRLDTIVDFDQVLVMVNGRIAEQGHPQTLIREQRGLFYNAYRQQRRTG